MTFDTSLEFAFTDEVTIEAFSSETAARVASYASAVTYPAIIEVGTRRTITGQDGRQVVSNQKVTLQERLFVDPRSRITLPSGFVPQQPPILGVESLKTGLGMDHTVLYLG